LVGMDADWCRGAQGSSTATSGRTRERPRDRPPDDQTSLAPTSRATRARCSRRPEQPGCGDATQIAMQLVLLGESRPAAAARATAASVIRFSVPRSSSAPHRPQLLHLAPTLRKSSALDSRPTDPTSTILPPIPTMVSRRRVPPYRPW